MAENYKLLHHHKNDDYQKPKELFKFIGDILEKNLSGRESFSCLDVGCAKGEFLYYLKKRFPTVANQFCGVDYSKNLIGLAQKFYGLSGVPFYLDHAEKFKINRKFDCITAAGIISYFDDYSVFIDNMLAHLKNDGILIITNAFSTSEYDVFIKFQKFDSKEDPESGWTQHSISGIASYVEKKGKNLKKYKFKLPFKLERQEDVLRSWTLDTNEGQKFINGLNLIWNLWSLEIRCPTS